MMLRRLRLDCFSRSIVKSVAAQTVISTVVPPEVAERLRAKAQAQDRSMSWLLRSLILAAEAEE